MFLKRREKRRRTVITLLLKLQYYKIKKTLILQRLKKSLLILDLKKQVKVLEVVVFLKDQSYSITKYIKI